SVCSHMQNPRVVGIEEKLDRLPFSRDGGAPIVLDLDREDEVLAHFHTVAREITDKHAFSYLAAETVVVRALSSQCELLGSHHQDGSLACGGIRAAGYREAQFAGRDEDCCRLPRAL